MHSKTYECTRSRLYSPLHHDITFTNHLIETSIQQVAESKSSHSKQLGAAAAAVVTPSIINSSSGISKKDVFVFQSHFFASPISLLNLSLVQQQELNAWTR
jgi:hypothetical protein